MKFLKDLRSCIDLHLPQRILHDPDKFWFGKRCRGETRAANMACEPVLSIDRENCGTLCLLAGVREHPEAVSYEQTGSDMVCAV